MRFGTFSRAPLKLLRVDWQGSSIECDWLMRPSDPWDRFIPRHLAERHQTLQALEDALKLREIVFKAFPSARRAEMRMFRSGHDLQHELMMMGTVSRSDETLRTVPSVAMRAKLCGFRFNLTQGVLESLQSV
jgi:hypothetical protein